MLSLSPHFCYNNDQLSVDKVAPEHQRKSVSWPTGAWLMAERSLNILNYWEERAGNAGVLKIIIDEVSIRNSTICQCWCVMAADAGAGKSRTYKSLTRRKNENNNHMGLGWSGLDLLDNKIWEESEIEECKVPAHNVEYCEWGIGSRHHTPS